MRKLLYLVRHIEVRKKNCERNPGKQYLLTYLITKKLPDRSEKKLNGTISHDISMEQKSHSTIGTLLKKL